jgi:uncharacterized membrane protein YhaH (DUF805 family)
VDKRPPSVFAGRIGRKRYLAAMAVLPFVFFGLVVVFDPFQLFDLLNGEQKGIDWNPFLLGAVGVTGWLAAGINAKRAARPELKRVAARAHLP